MGLFSPGWMSKDKNRALKAVENESDPDKLARAAQESPHADARIRALDKCNDQEVCQKAVLSDPHWEVRRAAAQLIRDQETLKFVAGTDSSVEVRKAAIANVDDEMYRIGYAGQTDNRDLALTAAEGVKSEKGMALLVVACGKSYIVEQSLIKLGDLKELSDDTLDILQQSSDPRVKEFLSHE